MVKNEGQLKLSETVCFYCHRVIYREHLRLKHCCLYCENNIFGARGGKLLNDENALNAKLVKKGCVTMKEIHLNNSTVLIPKGPVKAHDVSKLPIVNSIFNGDFFTKHDFFTGLYEDDEEDDKL